jgi:hypothetical protein
MKVVTAKVAGSPRNVNTRYGEKSVLDCRTSEGKVVAIWRPVGDPEVMNRANGERVTIAIDSKGKASLVETAETRAAEARQMGFTVEPEPQPESGQSDETANYIDSMARLYASCYQKATEYLGSTDLSPSDIKDVGTTLFIQTTRHLGL